MTLVTAKPRNGNRIVFSNGIDRLLEDFFRFDAPPATGPASAGRLPAVNILETAKDFQLELVVPGWEKTDLQLTVDKQILTISAENKQVPSDGIAYRRREFDRSGFQRQFKLPETVDAGAVSASYLNGILTVTLPKREEAQDRPARQIQVG